MVELLTLNDIVQMYSICDRLYSTRYDFYRYGLGSGSVNLWKSETRNSQ